MYNGSGFIDDYFRRLHGVLHLVDSVIIVDDGSTDDTPSKLKLHKKNIGEKVRINNKLNTGLPDSRNFGLDLVDTDYVLFLDVDDYICPRGLEKAIEYLCINKVDFIYGAVKYFSSEKKKFINCILSQLKKLAQPKFPLIQDKIFYNNYLVTPGSCIFLAKKAKEIRFDSSLSLGEDWDFFTRLIPFSSGAYVAEYEVNYFIYSKSMSSTLYKDKEKVNLLKSKMIANYFKAGNKDVNRYSQFLDLNFEYFFIKKSLHSNSIIDVLNMLFKLYFYTKENYLFKTINSIKLLLMRVL